MKQTNLISKLLSLFLIYFLTIHCTLNAQTITGLVRDNSGKPLTGATIELKGTTIKTQTNLEGQFKLDPNKKLTKTDKIVISFLGYINKEWVFDGSTSLILQMEPDDKVLGEVIVTALGIKREEKSLGFAAQTVKENAVKDAKN